MGLKPKYVLRFLGDAVGYYSSAVGWKGVDRKEAQELTHKEALKIQSYLKQHRIQMPTELEEVK